MGHTCEQHHAQPEPAPSMPDTVTARAPQPCPECPQLLRATVAQVGGQGSPREKLQGLGFGPPPERAEHQGSTAGMANPTPAPHSVPAEHPAACGLCVACSAGYYASQAALVTIRHRWEAAQVAACTWGCAPGMRGCCGRAAPFAAPFSPLPS